METCARCGADLGIGRFCLNCGHPVGTPVPPHEQLLPWREGEESGDAATAPLRWIPWVSAAGVILLLLVVLASCLASGDDDDDSPAESTPTATDPGTPDDTSSNNDDKGTDPAPARRPKPTNVAGQATITVPATAPPTQDLDGQLVSYEAAHMVDGDPATAWRMVGDGTGAILTVTLPEEVEVVRVGLINGYAKQVSGVDWYPANRRVLTATWGFDDGTTHPQTFTEGPASNGPPCRPPGPGPSPSPSPA